MAQYLPMNEDFRHRVVGAWGDAGEKWLSQLPEIVDYCATTWSLEIGPPFQLSYNYVAPAAMSDGTQVVLKLSAPDKEAGNERDALRLFDGDGICRLLHDAPELRAMVIERVTPGLPLVSLAMEDDAAATDVAIGLFQRIWRPPPAAHTFETLDDRVRGFERHRQRFDGGSGPLPRRLFDEGERCFHELLRTAPQAVLMHGDLHHNNILSATREPWLAIDPKGVVGDPGYDLGAFLYNPIPGLLTMSDPARVIARRIDQLADGLSMDRTRIRGWGMAQAVLSAIWSIEDNDDWSYAISFAEILSGLP